MSSIAQLLKISTSPSNNYTRDISNIPSDLQAIYTHYNGFFAFESALEIFPISGNNHGYPIDKWNEAGCWKHCYRQLAPDGICFAQDVFGFQFIYHDRQFSRFNSETAQIDNMASCIDEWAQRIIDDFDFESGYSIAHAWQQKNGPIQPKARLAARIPFVLGGLFHIDNLFSIDSVLLMHDNARLAIEVSKLSDGSEVHFERKIFDQL